MDRRGEENIFKLFYKVININIKVWIRKKILDWVVGIKIFNIILVNI